MCLKQQNVVLLSKNFQIFWDRFPTHRRLRRYAVLA